MSGSSWKAWVGVPFPLVVVGNLSLWSLNGQCILTDRKVHLSGNEKKRDHIFMTKFEHYFNSGVCMLLI